MKIYKFILSIIKKIESMKQGLIAYSYFDGRWHWICLNDFDFYMKNEKFKALSKAWHKVAKTMGIEITFAYCEPKEETLAKLADEDNLILNV